MPPTLYILSGLAFSGKSTLAKRLAEHVDAELVSFDPLWVENESKIPDLKEGWQFIRELAKEKILSYLQSGRSVVFDDTNPRREHREEFVKLTVQVGAKSLVVFVDTPISVIRERMKANLKDPQRHDVSEEKFQNNVRQLESPGEDENYLVFLPTDSVEDWLKKNF